MVHNPVLAEIPLSRNPLGPRQDIGLGCVGVLYKNGQFLRRLHPGEQPTMGERIGGGIVFIVDVAPRTATLDISLPDRSGKHYFPVRIQFEYQVEHPERMIHPRVSNTEAMIAQAIEPLLRRECQQFMLLEYETLVARLETLVTTMLFDGLGLRLLKREIEIRTNDEEFRAQHGRLTELLRPRALSLDLSALDRSGKYRFPVRIALEYQAKSIDVVLQQHETDVDLILREIEPLLRRECRRKLIYQYDELAAQVENEIIRSLFDSIGFKLLKHHVEIRFDDSEFQSVIQHLQEMLRPHSMVRDFTMIDESGKYHFPLRVTIDYKLSDEANALDKQIAGVEAQLEQVLTPLLRSHSRDHKIQDYRKLVAQIETAIVPALFHPLRVMLIQRSVEVRSDDDVFQTRLKQLQDLARQKNTAQSRAHHVQLPSQQTTYTFDAQVNVTYRLIDINELPSDTLEAAEDMLFPRVLQVLRRVSRGHKIGDEQAAEKAMHDEIGRHAIREFGLEVIDVTVAITPDQIAQTHSVELDTVDHEAELKRRRDEAERLAQARRLLAETEALKVYVDLIERGDAHVLAFMLAKNPDDIATIAQRLDEKHRQQLELQMSMINAILEKKGDALEPEMVKLFEGITSSVMGVYKTVQATDADVKQLGAGGADDTKQIADTADTPANTRSVGDATEPEPATSPPNDSPTPPAADSASDPLDDALDQNREP